MQEKKKINNKGQAVIFNNPILESLTKGHPLVIWSIYLPFIIGLPIYSITSLNMSMTQTIIIWFIALFSWTLFEYLAHRFIFHWMEKFKSLEKIVYVMHGNHHEYPRDKQRLFMPPIPSVLISGTLMSIFYLAGGTFSFTFFSGFIFGYLCYASLHYAIHAIKPPFKWLKPLWSHHHLHHYKNEEAGFGVSNTFWDRVFQTGFDIDKIKIDEKKVKELMFDSKRA